MRLFLALKPDRRAEARLAQRLLRLQEAVGAMAMSLRWTPATNIHVTLRFLGEVDPRRLRRLQDALAPTIAEPSFELELERVGVFPESGPPRVVWLDVVKGAEEISKIHAELGRRLAAAGFGLEPRPFSPHVTLARVPDRERARTKGLRESVTSVEPMPIRWTVDRVVLFRSDLSGSAPRYEAIQDIEFASTSSSKVQGPTS